MTDDGRYNILDMQRELGIDPEEDAAVRKEVLKLKVLKFGLDNRGENVVSRVSGVIAFVDFRAKSKVEVDDVWICTVESRGNVYYALPLIKVTPMMLMSISEDIRREITSTLWEKNRKGYEKDFAALYKDEVHAAAVADARKEMENVVNKQAADIEELQKQVSQYRIIVQSGGLSAPGAGGIELGSYDTDPDATAGAGPDAISLSSEVSEVESAEERPTRSAIPRRSRSPVPGMPEIRAPELKSATPKTVQYTVERVSEDVIESDSFTDAKYFVHISPDCKILVVRPHDFGSALCINRKIRLQNLGKLSPFKEKQRLNAEYSERYDGMIVYL